MTAGISYGRCQGGPYNKKDLAHHGEVFRVAIFKANPIKSLPAMQALTDPSTAFGEYRFRDGAWIWMAPPESE